jgi:hypothetical protein
MNQEGPQLETLTHRLAECPPEFLLKPRQGDTGAIDVPAIVADHFRNLLEGTLNDEARQCVQAVADFAASRQQLIAIVIWLLHDRWFLDRPQLSPALFRLLLADSLGRLSEMVRPETMVADPDRREELVRVCLNALGLRPRGETVAQATDRLTTLDSVERDRVVRNTRAAEARARKIREEMAKKAAQEAAARYSPE